MCLFPLLVSLRSMRMAVVNPITSLYFVCCILDHGVLRACYVTETMDGHSLRKHVELEFSTTPCRPDGWEPVVRKGLGVHIRRLQAHCSVLVYDPWRAFKTYEAYSYKKLALKECIDRFLLVQHL